MNIEWAKNKDGSYILFKLDEYLGHFRYPPRFADESDETVALKATIDDCIGIDVPVNRSTMALIDDLPAFLNPLAACAAHDLIYRQDYG